MDRRLIVVLSVFAASLGCRNPLDSPPPPPPSLAPVPSRPPVAAPGPGPAATPLPGFVPMTVAGIVPMAQGFTVGLTDPGGQVTVPIVIGENEASVIEMRLRGRRYPRPLTHDLLDSIVRELGGRVVMVEITELREGVFIANVVLWDGAALHRVDSRASDAIAVALGAGAPIYASQSVITQTGVPSQRPL